MEKIKVAILGGGVASLTTAYNLTAPEQGGRYEVTIYQPGWRLGGKGASGRNAAKHDRIEEHGLHIWLGCYDNAFATMRAIYQTLEGAEGILPGWRAAFKAQPSTPIGLGSGREFLQFEWPSNSDTPGDGHLFLTPWGAITEAIGVAKALLRSLLDEVAPPASTPVKAFHGTEARPVTFLTLITRWLSDLARRLFGRPVPAAGGQQSGPEQPPARGHDRVHQLFDAAHRMAASFGGDHQSRSHSDLLAVGALLSQSRDAYREIGVPESTASHAILQLLEIAAASMRGLLNPKYGILEHGFDLDRIDGYEFRQWLADNGAPQEVLDPTLTRAPFIRALYDLAFAYQTSAQGLVPNFAAGSALRCVIRIAGMYKGSGLYEMQAGMGETVVMPLYRVLSNRGVKFEFFRRLDRLEMSPDRKYVAKLHLGVQARTLAGEYRPTRRVGKLECWPTEPFWDQLVNGEAMKAAGTHFESHWCAWPDAGTETLEQGRDFDIVVLGIALGALMRLSPEEPSIVQELIDASPAFAATASNLGLIPTFAVQIWSNRTLEELGWKSGTKSGLPTPPPAAVGLVEPLDIWADVSHLLPLEPWDPTRPPRSLHYFCGSIETELQRRPAKDSAVPGEADALVRSVSGAWFGANTGTIWPLAVDPRTGGLDPAVLYNPDGTAPVGLETQYFRANVDPTECCVTTLAGTTAFRLEPDGTGVANLFVAGAWTRTGYNTEGVESAVMSGMRASRAISGFPQHVVGEHFMQKGTTS